ncbi:MAG: OmpA family protein [Rhodospirillaceae bacterium]|nr:OmpA family protein [Rhodospirillaceae bacterium]
MFIRTSAKAVAITLALSFSISAVSASAFADEKGYYVGVGVGAASPTDKNISGVNSGKINFDNSLMGSVSLGYNYASPWRGEVELSRRGGNVDTVSGVAGSGEVLATGIMANALYDFNSIGSIKPYVGAGLGFAKINLNSVKPFGAVSYNDSDNALAYQGIVGASYKIKDNLDFFTDYRYLGTQGIDVTSSAGNAGSFNYRSHAIMVGLRFAFGETKSAPREATESKISATYDLPLTYLVFFDWDKSDITPEAGAIIKTAAANAGEMGVVRLVLTGHADTSGPKNYNLALSKKRADAVSSSFLNMGFKQGEISVLAKGEEDPLIATGDGVREPQNRRVEIVIIP